MSKRFLLLFVLALALVGCSSGSNSPLTPQGSSSPDTMDNIPIIGMSMHEDGSFNALGMLGAYELIINPDNGSAELFAKRTPAIGEDYIVSGISFFTIAPCSDCLKIIGIDINPDGNAVLIFAINHPFKPGITSDPPSAANRLDLDVFDLAMVIAPTDATATTYSLTGVDVYPGCCVGPDGYTTELANVISDTSALPFFLAVDDSEGTSSTFNKFGMGDETTFEVGFNLATGTLSFDMYLTMGYGFSAKRPDRLTPKYYNPEFNRKAAWKVDVTPPGGTAPAMGNTWDDNDTATTYDVTVSVYDWQVGATVYTGDPLLFGDADADNVFASSEVSSVSVEIPGMNTALPSATTADSGAGTPIDPLIYTLAIANENQLAPGEYLGLVKVADERATLAPADGRDFIIDTPDGLELINYEMPEYATYQTFTATVVVGATACFVIDEIAKYYDGIGPDGTADNPVPTEWNIDFDASCSMGATSYDWDIDGDGTYEGTGGPLYTGGFPAGTAAGSYYPVLRLNGDDSLTFTSPDAIVVAPALYVRDNDLPGAAGASGTKADPFDLPRNAVAATTGGEFVMVFGGEAAQISYSTATNWNIDNDDVHVQGYQGSIGEPPWYHDWASADQFIQINGNNVVFDGFEFKDFDSNTTGPNYRLIEVTGDNVTISHCHFHEFGGYYKGGYVIFFPGAIATPIQGGTITNCLFHDATAWGDWGTTCAIYSNYSDDLVAVNNTIDNFHCNTGWCTRNYMYTFFNPAVDHEPEVRNNIATRMQGSSTAYSYNHSEFFYGTVGIGFTAYYCDAWNITGYQVSRFMNCTEDSTCVNVGTGSDPVYANGLTDHSLQAGSPCIDAGDPDTAYNDPDGSQNDIGCYGGPGGDWNFED
ncbi:hypothetical protein J7L05_02080 [bacterium]|nr:hypothetical protein [bacterium]